MKTRSLLGGGLLLAAAGCAPAVHLAEPATVSAGSWSAPVAGDEALSGPLAETIGSAELEALVARALAGNAEIGAAVARVEQARALLRIARGAMLPAVSASAGVSGSRGDLFDVGDATGGIDIGFELDLFGRGRAQRGAARHRLRASEFDRDAIALIVEAEVIRAFVQRAALSDRIAFLDAAVARSLELERIVATRHRLGAATRIETGLQTIQTRQLQTERVRLAEALERTRTALAVLAGAESPAFASVPARLDMLRLPAIDAREPAALLVRRPDIRAAEARIDAAGGDVAAARAAFFPTISLSVSGIAEAATLGNPLVSGASLGAGLLAPIFDRGRLRGNLDLSVAQRGETTELYRQALLAALAEVENALSAGARASERERLLDDMVEEARTTARLARVRYFEGEGDLQGVLDAELLLSAAEDARAIARQERLEAAIDLYKASGGNSVLRDASSISLGRSSR